MTVKGSAVRHTRMPFRYEDGITLLIAGALLWPVAMLLVRTWGLKTENWEHFLDFLLMDAVMTTLALGIVVILGAGVIGILAAWLVSCFDFPFRRLLEWLLVLPIAIPPYISAMVYAGFLSYTGTLQTTARAWGLTVPQEFLDIMSLPGAAFIFVITLYPYVYLIVRSFLRNHSVQYLENARLLGCGNAQILFRIILPLIRIPLAGALMLVFMEVISDYGVVKYYGLQTISTLIFKAWFGMRDLGLAGRLSFGLLAVVLLLQGLEESHRGRKGYSIGSGKSGALTPTPIEGRWRYFPAILLFGVFTAAFVIPIGQMLQWAAAAWRTVDGAKILDVFMDTVIISALSAAAVLLISTWFAHRSRFSSAMLSMLTRRLTQAGYSVPGAVIAVGMLIAFISLDGLLYPLYRMIDPETKKLVLSSGLSMLFCAFVVRYLAIGYSPVQSGFDKVGRKFGEAAAVLGFSPLQSLVRAELPLLTKSLMAGYILVFIDSLKELPLTLLLRPFNYDSLATLVYVYAGDERIHEASIPSLAIVALSLAAVLLLEFLSRKEERKLTYEPDRS